MTKKQINELAEKLLLWYEDKNNILKSDFFSQNKISPLMVKEFIKKSPNFKKAIEYASQAEENRLILGALNGDYNQSFVTFILKNIKGYTEEIRESENQYTDMSDEELINAAYAFAKKIVKLKEENENENSLQKTT